MSKEVVCLIGNGFDLALGLRTSYTDFRNFIEVKYGSEISKNLIYKALEKHTEGNWSDLEKQLGEIFKKSTWDRIFKDSNLAIKSEELQTKINESREGLIDDLMEYLEQEKQIFDKIQIDDEIKRDMGEGIKRFFSPVIDKDQIVLRKHQNIDREHINFHTISFNYTDFFFSLLQKTNVNELGLGISFNRYYPLHPHGNAEISTTIGVNDETQLLGYKEGESVLEEETAEYLIKSRKIEYGQDSQYEDARQQISEADIIIIYGMSFGETDKVWWEVIEKRLLEYKSAIAIVFSYEELQRRHDSKVEKVQKRIRNKLCCSSENATAIGERIIVECSTSLFSRIKSKVEEIRKQVNEVPVSEEEDTI